MALKQIAVGAWVETEAIGAITSKVEIRGQQRRQETKITSRTGAELYAHRTEVTMSDLNAVYAANTSHRVILRQLNAQDDPAVNPDQ